MSLKNRDILEEKGIQFSSEYKIEEFVKRFPFQLTNAQLRVLSEIEKDMESEKMMNRLLQGDVGSGKTAVAMSAAYKAVKCGYQVAIMALSKNLITITEMLDDEV